MSNQKYRLTFMNIGYGLSLVCILALFVLYITFIVVKYIEYDKLIKGTKKKKEADPVNKHDYQSAMYIYHILKIFHLIFGIGLLVLCFGIFIMYKNHDKEKSFKQMMTEGTGIIAMIFALFVGYFMFAYVIEPSIAASADNSAGNTEQEKCYIFGYEIDCKIVDKDVDLDTDYDKKDNEQLLYDMNKVDFNLKESIDRIKEAAKDTSDPYKPDFSKFESFEYTVASYKNLADDLLPKTLKLQPQTVETVIKNVANPIVGGFNLLAGNILKPDISIVRDCNLTQNECSLIERIGNIVDHSLYNKYIYIYKSDGNEMGIVVKIILALFAMGVLIIGGIILYEQVKKVLKVLMSADVEGEKKAKLIWGNLILLGICLGLNLLLIF
jgi:hypothetical protein